MRVTRIAFIGFGEAAKSFISAWNNKAPEIMNAFDIKTNSSLTRETKLLEYIDYGVQGTFRAQEAIRGAQVVFSLVTADQAETAIKDIIPSLGHKQLVLDCNSCSPQTKKELARLTEQQGSNYVDVAIMAPVLHSAPAIPVNLSGPKAKQAASYLTSLGFKTQVISERVGDASSIKMLRSILVKGFEALTTECLVAARKSGVEKQVLKSLSDTYPDLPLAKLSRYHMERMLNHGERRHSELKEVEALLKDLKIDHSMVTGAMNWHQMLGAMPIEEQQLPLEELSDEIIKHLHAPN
ncbi:DUF1932 domain-containing protein [Vibrio sp. ER1A]|uniref:DUF1932 domain-containing protein n=1 Tax=Vibrio sp. ER1A TaxID=1517681 RepID=UPI0004DD243A|nr:DUF1932 domain-containing protein [Vibrio sp. ER1A]KFA97421.1 6-phosphogluconate dehydrogenase [Vibrio sp. ER1A]